MTESSHDDNIKLSLLLNQNVFLTSIDGGIQKLSNDDIEVYLKNNKVELIIDKRDQSQVSMYYDLDTAFSKILGN